MSADSDGLMGAKLFDYECLQYDTPILFAFAELEVDFRQVDF